MKLEPIISIFSNESALCIRWPKYWSLSFSIDPSNEESGLISFRTSLVVQMVKCLPTMQETQVQSQGRGNLVDSVYGVAQSRTRLKRLSSSSSSILYWCFSF